MEYLCEHCGVKFGHDEDCPYRKNIEAVPALSDPHRLSVSGRDLEAEAWAWIEKTYGTENDDPVDRAYSADEMVDAFHAGAGHRLSDPDLGKIERGHVCKHGVRWPHPCDECDAASPTDRPDGEG